MTLTVSNFESNHVGTYIHFYGLGHLKWITYFK